MNYERLPNTIYVASLSYGKDSIAMLEAIKILGLPLDRIIHAEVWATDTIPADLPPMVEFKKYADKVIKKRYGVYVEHFCATRKIKNRESETYGECRTKTLHTKTCSTEKEKEDTGKGKQSDSQEQLERGVIQNSNCGVYEKVTYEKLFYHVPKRERERRDIRIPADWTSVWSELNAQNGINTNSQSLGFRTKSEHGATADSKYKPYGFPISIGRGNLCTSLKTKPFSSKPQSEGRKINIIQYLGIAADEDERVKKHTKEGNILPLVEIGWDEAYCRKWCEENDLLSPIYTTAARGGCWFCHNQNTQQLRELRHNYPDLWALLMKWDSDSPVPFKADGHTVHDFDRRFQLEDEGVLDPTSKRFRWSQIDEDANLNYVMEGFNVR